MDPSHPLLLGYSNRKMRARKFRAMRVLLPFSGGLIAGASLALGSQACAPSVIFRSELFIFSLLALSVGLIAIPFYASACIFSCCCVAKVKPTPISWKAAWSLGMAVPIFGMAGLGLVGVTCRPGMPVWAFQLPTVGVIYGSDSQPEVWGITLGLLSWVLLAGVAPMFLLDWAVTRAACSRGGAAKWWRILLAAMFVTAIVVAAVGGFRLAHVIGASNQTAKSVAISVVGGMIGLGGVIASIFLVDWWPARWLKCRLRNVTWGWLVLAALLLALLAIDVTEHVQAYLFERNCSQLAQWLPSHQARGSYSALPLPAEFAKLSDDDRADAILRPDGGVVLVLKILWFELIYSTSSNVPPEIKTDSFGQQYLPISGNPAYLIDRQLNNHFYLGEAYHIPWRATG